MSSCNINVESIITGREVQLIILLAHFESFDPIEEQHHQNQRRAYNLDDGYHQRILVLLCDQRSWLGALVLHEEP
jgi:hypothetical protein